MQRSAFGLWECDLVQVVHAYPRLYKFVECYEASSLSMWSELSMELFWGMFWSYSTNRGLRPPTETLLRKPLFHKKGVGAKTSTQVSVCKMGVVSSVVR
jgi:hypothetical protein